MQGAGHTVLFNENSIEFRRIESATERNELVLEFEGANPTPAIEGVDRLPGVAHFFQGSDPDNWHNNVSTYGAVIYRDLYPGIDMAYVGDEGILESEFYLSPGADHERIRLRYRNVKSTTIRGDGALVLDTDLGELVEKAPIAYQEIKGVRIEIEANYVLLPDEIVGIELGEYDPEYGVVIDPELVFSVTTSGANASAGGVVIDSDGNVILAGGSNLNFPVTDTIDGSNDASYSGLLMKLDGTSGDVLYSALFGGSKTDGFQGLALDQEGNMYLTGSTESDDFPTMNPEQATLAGGSDAFLVILSSDVELIYSTYLGGSDSDWASDIAVSGTGNVFVAGTTTSSDFPTTAGAFQQDYIGGDPNSPWEGDNFVTKYNAVGGVDFTTYLGGSGSDGVCGIVAGASGQLTIAGATGSTDFPLANAYQGTFGGGGDITVSRLSGAGDGLIYSTYIGGSGGDECSGIALGTNDEIFVSGSTISADFPVVGGESSPETGSSDGVLVMLDSAGQPVYSVRSNRPGDDKFVEVTVADSNKAFPVSAYADTIAILEKPLDGSLESFFAFEAPRIRVWAAHAAGDRLALAGDNAGAEANATKTSSSDWDLFTALIHLGTDESYLWVSKERWPHSDEPVKVGETITWRIRFGNSGPTTAKGVRLFDSAGIAGDGLSPENVVPLEGWEIGDLEPGSSTERVLTTKVLHKSTNLGYPDDYPSFVRNHATVMSEGWSGSHRTWLDVPVSSTDANATVAQMGGNSPGGKTGSRAEPVDVYLDSVLVADDLNQQTLSATADVEFRHAIPVLEIVGAGSPDNSNPRASFTLDLIVSTSDSTSRLSDHTLIILDQVSGDSVSALTKLDARLDALDPQTTEFFFANSSSLPFDVVLIADGTGKTTEGPLSMTSWLA